MRYVDAVIGAGVQIGNVSRWCRENGVDRRTFYRHRARIEAEGSWQPRSRRPGASPGATPAPVAAAVVRLRGELAPDNGADAIIAALGPVAVREDWAGKGWRVPHRSTVNKVLKRAGLVRPEPARRPRSSYRRFAYARPRDCYQIDATEMKLAGGGKAVVFEVLDDCTRLLAACQAADAETARNAAAAIQAAAAACGAPGLVLSDNGAAFGGGRARGQGAYVRAVTALGSRIIRSSPYHPQTCGKVERHHQTLKNWLATQPPATDLAGLQAQLNAYRDYYNTRRHHTAIRATPQHAWDTAETHGGPGHLPRQDDATIFKPTVTKDGTIKIGNGTMIYIGTRHAGTKLTAIRDNDHVTVYNPDGTPLGHLHINHDKRYQDHLKPAA